MAHILNTDAAKKDAAEKVLASIAEDLRIKAEDCRVWGAGRLITVIASTLKNGQPDPGWTVMYKWVSVSGLNSLDLAFPAGQHPDLDLGAAGSVLHLCAKAGGRHPEEDHAD